MLRDDVSAGATARADGMSGESDIPTSPPFPPKLIRKWLDGGTVGTDALTEEFRRWLAYFEGRA